MSDQTALPTETAPSESVGNADLSIDSRPLTLAGAIGADELGQLQAAFTDLTDRPLIFLDQDGQPIALTDIDQARCNHTLPIIVEGRPLGALAVEAGSDEQAVIGFVELLGDMIMRLCRHSAQVQLRVNELHTLYMLTTLMSGHHELQQVLDAAARSAAEVMKVKAVSIRLLDDDGRELVPASVHNLSQQYLEKGPILVANSELYQRSLDGEIVYVQDMATDPRVLYPEDARREGLVSILAAPMMHQGSPIGVVRLYTGRQRTFNAFEIDMLRAVAQLLGAAIANARLNLEHVEHQHMQQQLRLAADIQRRMLPAAPPNLPPFDIAARYVPSLELDGDFYDFVSLDGHLGVAVGDVVGKGVPASLLMASVRASLRAYAQDVYDLDEIISRVNVALTRDTRDNEFATLFYGVIDPATMRLTYCNAGHEPPLLLRDGEVQRLGVGGMIAGVDPRQRYDKALIDLKGGDLVLIFTDGLIDAQSFTGERFGRERIIAAMRDQADASARDAMNHVLWQMRRFVGLNRSQDDTTLVAIKVSASRGRPHPIGQ